MFCRKGIHYVIHANQQLIRILRARGPTAVVDLDNVAQRVTLDVIGRVGFDKDFGATQSLDDDSTNRAFELMNAGLPLAHWQSCRSLAHLTDVSSKHDNL